jgi:hypothetical protein
MNEAEHNRLVEKAQRQKLDMEEQFELEMYLATRPELRAVWEEDQGLNQVLRDMPNAPVSSNFTARVMQEIDRDSRPVPVSALAVWWREISALRWARPLAMACVLVGVGVFSVYEYRMHARAEFADSLKQLTRVPSVEMLRDFEAINRLSQTQAKNYVDQDFLTAPE